MANRTQVTVSDSIVRLYKQGWRKLRIARELRVDVKTVRRHIREAANSLLPPAGTSGADGANSILPPAGSGRKAGTPTQREPYAFGASSSLAKISRTAPRLPRMPLISRGRNSLVALPSAMRARASR